MGAVTSIGALVGVAKQTQKGSLAANPTFAHGVAGSAPILTEVTENMVEVTTGSRAAANVYREKVAHTGNVQSPAYLKSLGLYLLGAIGTDVVTGSAPNYTHTYATGDLPYLSLFAKGIGGDIQALRDCKIDELTLSWEGTAPVEITVKANGTVLSFPATFSAGTDEKGSESFLVPVGGTFSYDVVGSSPAQARVVGGSLTITNSVNAVDASHLIESEDQIEGRQDHSLSLTVVPADLSDFRKIVTGSANGSSVSAVSAAGSVSLTFKENGGNGTLVVTGSKIAFMTNQPEADPNGAPVQIELAGMPVNASGAGAPLIYALTNAQASY